MLLLIFSVAINIISSYLVGISTNQTRKKWCAILGVTINLITLAFFKYSGLIAITFFNSADTLFDFLNTIPLPIGISFFTFQGISLVVDTYRDELTTEEKNKFPKYGLNVALFISFFPQLIAGPIVKAHDFIPQIKTKTRKDIHWEDVIKYLILGYFLKSFVADNLKDYTYWIAYPFFETKSSITLIFMLFGYSMQIFSDFAGYSLIAIGIAGLFGYQLKQNFNFPYIAQSFSDFWKRWHISLSSFLKEYLYFPLGGNRKGKVRTYINLLLTMILGGLWHGAAWSYAVWGLFHGILLATERLLQDLVHIRNNHILKTVKFSVVFIMVSIGWLLFKLPEFSDAVKYIYSIIHNTELNPDYSNITYIIIYSTPIIVYHISYLLRSTNSYNKVKKYSYLAYGFMLFLILTNSGTSQEFIYFQF
ncbi:MBOAT family O-acyltransferase [Reichenbachiella sp. MALMAid0571]|uniref:MBOAT family O-acyltransferase n=1 Tax=Reichenbachiella sp. MALMAid0571 TaxID=3143939 RepID=UPI0032DE9DF7